MYTNTGQDTIIKISETFKLKTILVGGISADIIDKLCTFRIVIMFIYLMIYPFMADHILYFRHGFFN